MPNRILKESITTSESLARLTAEAEVFWYRLLVTVDDYGRCDARPSVLRAHCFPVRLDSVSEAHIEGWLGELIGADLVFCYAVDGKPYLEVTHWQRHNKLRAKYSKYPAADTCKHVPAVAGACNHVPIYTDSDTDSDTDADSDADAKKRVAQAPRAPSTAPASESPRGAPLDASGSGAHNRQPRITPAALLRGIRYGGTRERDGLLDLGRVPPDLRELLDAYLEVVPHPDDAVTEKELDFWIKTLRRFREVGYTPDDVREAATELIHDGLRIKSPKSLQTQLVTNRAGTGSGRKSAG